jgi:TonB family protein
MLRPFFAALLGLLSLSCASDPPPVAAVPQTCHCNSRDGSGTVPCQGWVIVHFDIATNGLVKNARTGESCGNPAFHAKAEEGVAHMRFRPRTTMRHGVELLIQMEPPLASATK